MGGKKKVTSEVSRKEFLLAIEELKEVLDGKRPYTGATEAASHTMTKFAQMKEAYVRAKRKRMSKAGKET